MFDQARFSSLISRIRQGDQDAAAELVRDYESLIRREVRMRLDDRRLLRVLDSMDVCQSVLASFFVRTAMGEYDVTEPQQLTRLLVTMTRNKVASAARREHSQKRDQRMNVGDSAAINAAQDSTESPSQIVANAELLERVRQMLPSRQQRVAELRGCGETWETIAEQLGGTAQACRVQYTRTMQQIRQQLNLGDN